MANPTSNNTTTTTNNNMATGDRSAVPESSLVVVSESSHLKLWTHHEQSLLEELLTKCASDNLVKRCAKIVLKLPGKTLTDVALRLSWMKVNAANPQVKPSPLSPDGSNSTVTDDDISYEETEAKLKQLVEENVEAMNQIPANFSALKVDENMDLFSKTRNNIIALSSENLDDVSEMKKMPPLPIKLNGLLANEIIKSFES